MKGFADVRVADEKAALAAFAAVSGNTDAILRGRAPVSLNQAEHERSFSSRHVRTADGGIREILLVQTQSRTNRGVLTRALLVMDPKSDGYVEKRDLKSMVEGHETGIWPNKSSVACCKGVDVHVPHELLTQFGSLV